MFGSWKKRRSTQTGRRYLDIQSEQTRGVSHDRTIRKKVRVLRRGPESKGGFRATEDRTAKWQEVTVDAKLSGGL